jgi:pimeloyl-ACP methyl ester carboxylesterase
MADAALGEATVEIVTMALGAVEVTRLGAGPPIIMIHGTPGGSDSSVAMGRFLVEAGCELIAPSRPGDLGTALDGRGAIGGAAPPPSG